MDDLPELNELNEMPDGPEKARRASELVTHHQYVVSEASRIRREQLNWLVAADWTKERMADLLGVSRPRVGQLLSAGPKPERALLGTGKLTVAMGSKEEPAKATTTSSSSMTSVEIQRAYQVIADAAGSFGLEAEPEHVPPNGGLLRLNRPNLIVIGSPRLLPLVGQVLESDPNLGFGCGSRGWYLTEGKKRYRSPIDSGKSSDLGYLGRLPRTDSKGHFLYIAGIHAIGTLGAATYLVNNLAELYAEVKNRRWSMLVETTYDPDVPDSNPSRRIKATARFSKLYVA